MMKSLPPAPAFLTARIEERILAPIRRSRFTTRTGFVVTLASVVVLHGSLLALLLLRDSGAPAQVARQETPIEVVIEPPKPKAPVQAKAPEPPKPQVKQEIEKPASSSPRAPTQQKVDTASLQKETYAPKAPTPPNDGEPDASKEAASPTDDPAKSEATEKAASKPDVLQKDAEAIDRAVPEPPKRPEKLARSTPRAKIRRPKTALEQLAGASSLPDYSFARPTKKSPVYGGSEDSRYLAIVYGMIMARRSRVGVPGEGGNVTITFNVDSAGNLIGMEIQQSSGFGEIDEEAAAAIRRASPFPPPPLGAPHSLIATIDFGQEASSYTMGNTGR